MESLYRKYRPQTFDDVVGQRHVVETLERAVLEGRTSHAYLFCGPRGTGKTTMARLLAKALLCEQGPGHLPDGTCEECELIAAGEHPDVYELDAASRTGVDNVREEIINRVSYAPVRGRYKVYIIDEVHMLTTAAFNALLKTLEEPPEHIVFVLCTTDPQKIPATILSRVQRFDFHAIGKDDIQARLVYVCEQEGFTYDEAALELVVRHARGGMRDALSTLEQLSVFGDGTISLDAAQDLLGEVPGSALRSVADALAKRDVATLFGEVAKLVDAGRDLLQFTRELAGHMRDVYVVAAVGAKPGVVDVAPEELEALRAEAESFGSVDRVARILTILGDASAEMRVATNQRLTLEVALTRMARPKADVTLDALAERVDELERQVALLSRPGAAARREASGASVGSAPAQPEATTSVQTRPVVSRPTVRAADRVSAQAPGASRPVSAGQPSGERGASHAPASRKAVRQPARTAVQASSQAPQPPVTAPSRAARADAGQLQRQWKQVVETLTRTSASRGSLLLNSTLESDDGSTLVVTLPKGSSFALRMLERKDVRGTVDPVVQQVFGSRQVRFSEAGPTESGAVRAAKKAQAQASAARQRRQPTVQPEAESSRRTAPAATPVRQASEPPAPPVPGRVQPSSAAGQHVYAMPWDEPDTASQVAPTRQVAAAADYAADYDVVPYDDASASSFDEGLMDEPAIRPGRAASRGQGMPEAQPAPQGSQAAVEGRASVGRGAGARPQVASTTAGPPQEPMSAAQSNKGARTQPASTGKTASTAKPSPAPRAQTAGGTVAKAGVRKVPDDIPPDLTAILESAFDVFGEGVTVSTFKSEPQDEYEDDTTEAVGDEPDAFDEGDDEDDD